MPNGVPTSPRRPPRPRPPTAAGQAPTGVGQPLPRPAAPAAPPGQFPIPQIGAPPLGAPVPFEFGFGFGQAPPPPPTAGRDIPPLGPGGFTPSPRLISSAEIAELNRQRIAQGLPPFSPQAFRIRQQLGPFGFIADPTTFGQRQLGLIEARLNFENFLQAQAERQEAINLLGQQLNLVGATPEQQQVFEVARRRLAEPDPFTPEEVAQQQAAIRQRGAIGLEAAQRQQREALARQGVAGGVTAFQEAQLRQQAARQVSDELQRLAIEQALQRDINEAQALAQLQGITSERELRQIALNQAITNLLTAERGEFDLSGLAAFLPAGVNIFGF